MDIEKKWELFVKNSAYVCANGWLSNILCVIGIITFYFGNYVFTYIGAFISTIECVIRVFTGRLKTLFTIYLGAFIGILIVKKFYLGASIGICYEVVISMILGNISYLLLTHQTLKNNKDTEMKQANYEIQQMQEQAKQDLKSGISRTKAKDMLINGIITQEQYDDIIKNIENLEMLAYFDWENFQKEEPKNTNTNLPNLPSRIKTSTTKS